MGARWGTIATIKAGGGPCQPAQTDLPAKPNHPHFNKWSTYNGEGTKPSPKRSENGKHCEDVVIMNVANRVNFLIFIKGLNVEAEDTV